MDVLREVCIGRPTGNEENIKVKLVAPILQLLGYDPIHDFDYERHVQRGRPDIALLVGGRPRLVVEAKGLDKDLEDFKVQGLQYAADAGVPWTVLTNGVQWDLYKTSIEGVAHSENEPVLTVLSRNLPTKFNELEDYISKRRIGEIEETARNQVAHVARRAKVSDLAKIMQRFRVEIFNQLRSQFNHSYPSDRAFASKIDKWITEQAIDKNYDWHKVFLADKKFRAFILSLMRQNGLPSKQKDFTRLYRKAGHEETTTSIEAVLRREGIPIDWPDKLCFEGAYSLINRLLFLRICEDSRFVTREITPDLVTKISRARDNAELVTRLEGMFAAMKSEYPGVYRLPLLDHLQIADLEWSARAVADVCGESLRYNFAELGDVLGDLYQRHLDHNARRLIGQFYTHQEKVDFMVGSVEPWLVDGARMLDPACGSGSFLVGAHARLLPRLIASGYTPATAHGHLLEDMLYGIDIDSFAAQLAAINLLVRNMAAPVRDLKIYLGNSLTGDHGLARFGVEITGTREGRDPRGGRPEESVSGVLRKESFDVILGNPPFFRVGLTDPIYGSALRSNEYSVIREAGSEVNIATMFLKRCVDLLKPSVSQPPGRGGVAALILPKSVTYVDEYRLVREYLLDRCRLLKIVDLGRGWQDVGLEHVILVFERKQEPAQPPEADASIEVIHNVESFRRGLFQSHPLPYGVVAEDSRRRLRMYLAGPARTIYDKMVGSATPLREWGMTVWEGIRDDHGVAKFASRQNERSVPLLDGKAVRRWFTTPDFYVDSGDTHIPLGIREKCRVPTKLVIKRVLSSKVRVEATVDDQRSITHSSTTAVSFPTGISPSYVAGVLNSRLINLFVRDWEFNRTELTMNFREEYLGEIPVPKTPPSALQATIETAVARLRELSKPSPGADSPPAEHSHEIELVKGRLDEAVYSLYGLTKQEKELLEGLMPYSD
jgi:hypothetical protein